MIKSLILALAGIKNRHNTIEMPTTDTSFLTRTAHKGGRTLFAFKAANPNVPEQGPHQGTDQSTRSERRVGGLRFVSRVPGGETSQESFPGPQPPTGVTDLTVTLIDWNIDASWNVTWTPDPNATSYEIGVDYPGALVSQPTNSSVTFVTPNYAAEIITVTVFSVNSAGRAAVSASAQACFLAGTPVYMADGTAKAIEDVIVGDSVIGAFGETNPVLALQRVYLGNSRMYKINGEHSTSDHHPHVSVDRRFYTPVPGTVDNEVYGKTFPVIGADGPVMLKLHGLKKGRVQTLEVGAQLKTIDGSREVLTLEPYDLPFETPLFNLVVGGSHTYHADGYAVTGWPREDDFDYDNWIPR